VGYETATEENSTAVCRIDITLSNKVALIAAGICKSELRKQYHGKTEESPEVYSMKKSNTVRWLSLKGSEDRSRKFVQIRE
jgi:hypothetical protein